MLASQPETPLLANGKVKAKATDSGHRSPSGYNTSKPDYWNQPKTRRTRSGMPRGHASRCPSVWHPATRVAGVAVGLGRAVEAETEEAAQ